MKKLLSIVLMNILCMASEAQVTYFDSNNFFLNYFTDTGYSSYDWRFEPLKQICNVVVSKEMLSKS